MIAHKIARVLSGSDPHDFQHWEDIAGYATAFMRTWSELHEDEDEDEEDADAIENETTKESKINLNTCKIGQKLKLRDGGIVSYEGPSPHNGYPHRANCVFYTNDGKFYDDNIKDELDIVEILPLENEDESDGEEDAAFQPVKDIAGRFPQVEVKYSGMTSPDALDSKALADGMRTGIETAINKFRDCSGGFCPMPNVRQGPAVMFDPAD